MKLLFDFLPIIIFFIAYKIAGIYVATAVAIVATFTQVAIFWIRHRKVESLHIVTLVLITVLGTATLLLHNQLFIKWKPTAIYWVFSLLFLGSQFFGKQTMIERLMKGQIELKNPQIWKRLNFMWAVFFLTLGSINVYVLYHFDTNTWVNFKLFGTLILTLVFVIIQAIYISRHVIPTDTNSKES